MKGAGQGEPGLLLRAVLGVLLAAGALGLGTAVLNAPPGPGLAAQVGAQLEHSGVESAVTAVLLTFRGYDTLLEIAVLTAALVGVWALRPRRGFAAPAPSPVLAGMTSALAAVMPVVCGYLLWAGASRPGGAFQAGAVLASLGVLLILSGSLRPRRDDFRFRVAAIVGLAVFLAVALGVMGAGGQFLQYPASLAGALILSIEAAAAVSIAVILTGLFQGGPPPGGR